MFTLHNATRIGKSLVIITHNLRLSYLYASLNAIPANEKDYAFSFVYEALSRTIFVFNMFC